MVKMPDYKDIKRNNMDKTRAAMGQDSFMVGC